MLLKSFQLFVAFFKVGIFGYGGGTALIPLIEEECVDNHMWIADDKFKELIVLTQSVPGVFATKMAAYIGYQTAGILGMLAAVLGIVLPGVALLFLIYGLLLRFKDVGAVQNIIMGVNFGAAGLIAYSIFKVLPERITLSPTHILGLLLAVGVLVGLKFFKLNPFVAIIISAVFGLLFLRLP